ncbi:MAG: hypothetical protein ACMUIE_06120 [Thermoplasmatota archaeon]
MAEKKKFSEGAAKVPQERSSSSLAPKAAIAAGAAGAIFGLLQMVSGSSSWVFGSKEQPVVLGLITILLAFMALFSSYKWLKRDKLGKGENPIILLMGILIPGVVCFFTVGPVWFLPGPVLLVAGGILFRSTMLESGKDLKDTLVRSPSWKMALIFLSCLFIISPVVLGLLWDDFSLFRTEVDGSEVWTAPIDLVRREDGGKVFEEEVTGLMVINISLLVCGLSAAVSGSMGARTISIGLGASSFLVLVFAFIFAPNILFFQGGQMEQFSTSHFGSASFGFYFSLLGSILEILFSWKL